MHTAWGNVRVYRKAVFPRSPLSGAGAAHAGCSHGPWYSQRSMCSSEHHPALLLISPVCFSAFAHLLIYCLSCQCQPKGFCGQTDGTKTLLDAIFCPRVHRSFSAGLFSGHGMRPCLPACLLLLPAWGPRPMVAWETMSSLFKGLPLLLIILLFKNKK